LLIDLSEHSFLSSELLRLPSISTAHETVFREHPSEEKNKNKNHDADLENIDESKGHHELWNYTKIIKKIHDGIIL